MDAEGVFKLGAVGVGGEQAGEDGGAAGDERAAGEPDVQPVRRRERRHWRSFAQTLNADLGDREPFFDQQAAALVWAQFGLGVHAVKILGYLVVSRRRRAARTRREFWR